MVTVAKRAVSMAESFGCARPVVFRVENDEGGWWCSEGGCLLLVRSRGRIFCVVPQHCLKDFSPYDLVIANHQIQSTEGVRAFFVVRFHGIGAEAEGMDVEDIVVVSWPEPVPLDVAHVIDLDDIATAEPSEGDDLAAFGMMKDWSEYGGEGGTICYNFYDLKEVTRNYSPLRTGIGNAPGGQVATVGFSGGLVWNRTRGGVAGITLRGGASGGRLIFHYMPIGIVKRMVEYVRAGLGEKGLIDRQWPARIEFNYDVLRKEPR